MAKMDKMSDVEKKYWKDEEKRMKGILRSLRAAYTHDCFKEKRPDACYNLADLWSGLDREYKKAHDMYEKMCLEHKHPHSCFKYGSIRRTGGTNIPKDENAAIEALGYACEQECNPEACYEYGLAVLMGSDDKYVPDEKAAFESIQKACLMGHSVACMNTAQAYYDGKMGAPNRDKYKAIEFAKQACNQLRWDGCRMVWKMYEQGDGVEKNSEIARRYRLLTRALREQAGLPMDDTKGS